MRIFSEVYYCDDCGVHLVMKSWRTPGQIDWSISEWVRIPDASGKGHDLCPACARKPENRELVLSSPAGAWRLESGDLAPGGKTGEAKCEHHGPRQAGMVRGEIPRRSQHSASVMKHLPAGLIDKTPEGMRP